MNDEPYKPVSCALHSEYELLAMQRATITLQLQTGESLSGVISDITTRAGEEFLLFTPHNGTRIEIRLDQISALTR